MSAGSGRSNRLAEPVVGVGAGVEPAPAGCGCQAATALLVVPLALEIVALLLIWPGPASGDWWFAKGLLVALGGLLATAGLLLAPVAVAARSMSDFAATAGLRLYSTAASVLAGEEPRIVALRGRAEADSLADLPRAPLSGQRCLWWGVSVQRLAESEGDESEDEGGHEWAVLREETGSTPFWLRDATGRIRVDPAGALVGAAMTDEREVYRADGAGAVRSLERDLRAAGLDVALTWTPETAGFVAQEEVLEAGTEVTAIGPAVVRDGERMIAAGEQDDPFSISPYDELDIFATFRRTARRLRVTTVVLPLVGIALVAGGFWWVLTG